MESGVTNPDGFHQNLIVMRHGHRLDNFDESWEKKAERPWDPPLTEKGCDTAFAVGSQLKKLSLPIHRIFVSPFLRCVQTASNVVAALCSADDNEPAEGIDPSRVKVSIEFGLCEVLNNYAIRPKVAPTNGDLGFNLSELEALLPAGTVDQTLDRVYQEGTEVFRVGYCAYSHAARRIQFGKNKSFTAGSFQLLDIGPHECSICFEAPQKSDGI
ncbi:hypothetical protein Nepgr_023493 [Nepenthes gracilis]|uniref:Uncharacterized protein n=1 Tax=Nepenthes gracilis TaxID=150966 RepID=A0AAD3T4D5_NEPGR|nr:hypothetical protein Nepgr_023493 [Nepenthes gracilis]